MRIKRSQSRIYVQAGQVRNPTVVFMYEGVAFMAAPFLIAENTSNRGDVLPHTFPNLPNAWWLLKNDAARW